MGQRVSVIQALAEVVSIEAVDAIRCALAIRRLVRARTPTATGNALALACFVDVLAPPAVRAVQVCRAACSSPHLSTILNVLPFVDQFAHGHRAFLKWAGIQ